MRVEDVEAILDILEKFPKLLSDLKNYERYSSGFNMSIHISREYVNAESDIEGCIKDILRIVSRYILKEDGTALEILNGQVNQYIDRDVPAVDQIRSEVSVN